MPNHELPLRERLLVGIDPGIIHTGMYAVSYAPGFVSAATPLLCTSRSEPMIKPKRNKRSSYWHWTASSSRLASWAAREISMLEHHFGSPVSCIGIEDFVWIGKRRTTSINMCKLIGRIYEALQRNKYMMRMYNPGVWRHIVSQHNAIDLYEYIRKQAPPQNDHEDDAFGICVAMMIQIETGELNVL